MYILGDFITNSSGHPALWLAGFSVSDKQGSSHDDISDLGRSFNPFL
jgi:hypothetical protein